MSPADQASTIFLTPEETARIERNVRSRLRQCKQRAGQPHVSQDALDLRRQVIGASLMADIAGGSTESESIPVLTVGQVYPPCTRPLKALNVIKLPDLSLETHHRGSFLRLQRSLPVVTLRSRSWTVVEDVLSGESERLEVCLHKTRYAEEFLESTTEFVLKEPYLTLNDQGQPTLRVDHPSDLVAVDSQDGSGSEWRADSATEDDDEAHDDLEKEASVWKEKGNASLKECSYVDAHASYTKGLVMLCNGTKASASKLYHDLHRNRAHVDLLLSRFEEAKDDALASIADNAEADQSKLDVKAYFRAGSAAYRLKQYDEAIKYIEKELQIEPSDKEASARLQKTKRRTREATAGIYDFSKLRASLSRHYPRVDAASFLQTVEVKQSPGKGRGLFAKRAFKPGDLVMVEKAYCVVWAHERDDAWTSMTYDVRDDIMRVSPSGLCAAVVQKMRNNPGQAKKVLEMYSDYAGLGGEVHRTDGEAVVDTFQVHDIVSRNAFGPGEQFGHPQDSLHASTGLWITAAYTNHSCLPNVEKEFVGDLLLLRATRNIAAGDEVYHSYVAGGSYKERRKALMTTWNFECDCKLCIRESKSVKA